MNISTEPLHLEYAGAYLTVNRARKANHWQLNAMVQDWRATFHLLALAQRTWLVPFDRVDIEVHHYYTGNAPDPGAVFYPVKGAIDGLVDAGVLPDDSGIYVRRHVYHAPVKVPAAAARIVIDLVPVQEQT